MAAAAISPYPELPLPLSAEQSRVIDRYTKEGVYSSCERCWYFFVTPENRIILIDEVARNALEGAKYGGIIGAGVGFGVGCLSLLRPDISLLSHVISAGMGFLGGGTVGAGAGALILGSASAINHIKVKISAAEYKAWRLEKIESKVVSIFEGVAAANGIADELETCPISHELIIEPVTTGRGRTYERAEIEEWLRRVTTGLNLLAAATEDEDEKAEILRRTSPLRDEHITEANLHYDTSYHPRVLRTITQLLKRKAEDVEIAIPEAALGGLRRYAEMVRAPADELCRAITAAYHAMYEAKRISHGCFVERVAEVNKHYSKPEE